MKIKHFSGEELLFFLGEDTIQSRLDFYSLEYFFSIYPEKNYLLLFNENDKIIGQITYISNRKGFLLSSISITKNNQGYGYSKLLLDEYFKLIENKTNTFNLTEFSDEGEICLSRYIDIALEDRNMLFHFVSENDFIL